MVQKKVPIFLAANEWIWPKIIAEYSPEDIYNADETRNFFVLCMTILICLEMKVLKFKCVNFWVFPRRLVYIGRRFETLCQVHLQKLDEV
jgi:hypothetical protein